ncbi:MFS transporter [Georgenia sp. MJ206]|uniref:MFS transporter n=1 Tax=Georgenia wangjunii TaxID=3117730 RepID=UPI002F26D769
MRGPFARVDDRARRSSWLVWLAGACVYFLAVLHRASLGVAGPDAIDRLGISATELGSFVMVQLGIYAAMQVPAGLAIDRWGPRRVLLVATLVLGVAQTTFAFATGYPVALAARALLGMGDAAVFIAVLRLAAMWFPRRRYAILTTATGLFGMAGNLVATVPLVIALEDYGWTRTFAITGLTSVAYALLLLRPAIAAPYREVREPAQQPERTSRRALADVAASWGRKETRLAFWTHQATMTPGGVISLVWGYPFLTEALGYSNAAAAGQLSLYVVATLAASFFIGPFAGRRPGWRMPIAVTVSVGGILAVVALVAWPGDGPPPFVVTTAFIVLALGGPASQVAFHIARDYNPPSRISTATGLVNSGGFAGAMIAAILVGIVLDARSGTAAPTLGDYRWAIGSVAVLALASTLAMVATLLSVRIGVLDRMVRQEDVVVPVYPRWWDQTYARLSRMRVEEDDGGAAPPRDEGPDAPDDDGAASPDDDGRPAR